MVEKLKTYFFEVVLRKYGPSFAKGAVAWLFVYLGAHQGLLNSLGITYDTGGGGHVLQIDLDMLSVWAVTVGSGAIMAALTAAQHHGVATVTGEPQSGDKRETPTQPMAGGERAGDPPKGETK